MCNDATIQRTGFDDEYYIRGSATEGALLIMSAKLGVFKDNLQAERLEEIPFSSDRKMMSVLCLDREESFVYAKGAPEVILSKCSHFCKSTSGAPLA